MQCIASLSITHQDKCEPLIGTSLIPSSLAHVQLCPKINTRGADTYHPDYMIKHSMSIFK